jgi:hypothetical protein
MESEKDDEKEGDDARNDESTRERGADPREMLQVWCPVSCEPVADALVPRGHAVDLKQDLGEREPERDHCTDDHEVTEERSSEKCQNGPVRAERRREPLGDSAAPWLQEENATRRYVARGLRPGARPIRPDHRPH